MGTKDCRVYEKNIFQPFTGEAVRPGGLELTDIAMKFCNFPAGTRILDIGCGSGITVEHLCEKYKLKAIGMDPSDVLLTRGLKRNPCLNLFKGYGENIPYPNGDIDAIITECSLSLMQDVDIALKEIYRVLKDDGIFIITDLYWREGRKEFKEIPAACCINGAFYKEELERKLKRTGFRISTWEDYTDLYQNFVAQIIFHYGSIKAFWDEVYFKDESKSKETYNAISGMKLGYFLLIAQK